MHLVFFVFM